MNLDHLRPINVRGGPRSAVSLESKTYKRLRVFCKVNGVMMARVAREAIIEWLDRHDKEAPDVR
jgi:hypothetical protein